MFVVDEDVRVAEDWEEGRNCVEDWLKKRSDKWDMNNCPLKIV